MNLTRKFQTLFFSAKDVQDYFVSFSARLIFGEFDIIWKNDADDFQLWKYRHLFYVLSIDPFKVVSAGHQLMATSPEAKHILAIGIAGE